MGHVAVVLAAGQGTRMRSVLPKVLHPVAGLSMLAWVLAAVTETKPERIVVVVGHGSDQVIPTLPDGGEHCVQAERLGTGHAASVALDHMGHLPPGTDVLVVPGDTPLLDGGTLTALLDAHESDRASLTLASAVMDDPDGYGRVVRDGRGRVSGVVEHADADEDQRAVAEVNAGVYVFDGATMSVDLASLGSENAQGEYYLPDLIAIATRRGDTVTAVRVPARTVAGVNSHLQLAAVGRLLRHRIAERWMTDGVRIIDPDSVFIDADVELSPGVVLYPGVHLEAGTTVGPGAVVGPDVFLSDSSVGSGSRVWYSVVRGSEIAQGCEVGPYASLRPGTVLEEGAKLGTFVETKKTVVGAGSKVPHLSYLGDATIGERSNIGAGTITCNYDGFTKHPTVIGNDVFIGSDTMLVAPVTVGDGAMTGAGSVITLDVEPGAMGIARGRQRNIAGFVQRMADRYRARRSEADSE